MYHFFLLLFLFRDFPSHRPLFGGNATFLIVSQFLQHCILLTCILLLITLPLSFPLLSLFIML